MANILYRTSNTPGTPTNFEDVAGVPLTNLQVDGNFKSIQVDLGLKANAANAALTGTPTAPTATAGTNTTQLATTEFVATATTNERTATATLTNKTLTTPIINTNATVPLVYGSSAASGTLQLTSTSNVTKGTVLVGGTGDAVRLNTATNGFVKTSAANGTLTYDTNTYYNTGGTDVAVADGGTGLSTAPANGQLLIGNGTGYTLGTLTDGTGITITEGAGTITVTNSGVTSVGGTANRVTVTGSTGAVTFNLPQDIHTGATPSFAQVAVAGNPSSALQVATKQYVDDAILGLDVKASVKVATTANIVSSNGSAPNVLDGVTLQVNDRILVKNQTTPAQNGLYYVSSVGTGSNGIWARTTDMDTWNEVPGSFVFVEQGATFGDTGWVCTADAGGTIGTSAITWTQFAGTGSVTSGTGITVTGNQVSIDSAYVGQSTITTLGTIATGTWQGTVIAGQYGGTGVNNSGKTITLGGNLTTIGAFATSLTATAPTSLTLPTSGTLATLAGAEALSGKTSIGIRDTSAAFDVTIGATSSTALTASRALTIDVVNAARIVKLGGNLTIGSTFATVGTFGTGGNFSTTGTFATGGNFSTANAFTTVGAFGITLTATAATSVTLPLTGVLSTLAGTEAFTNKTYNGLNLTAAATGFTIAGGTTSKTLTVNSTLAFTGTDSTTMTFPTTSAVIARTDAAQTFTGIQTFSSAPVFNALPTGTGVASAATASTLAARDADANLTADAFISTATSTATAAGTTTLTVGSTDVQVFTGTTTQTVTLPVTSTLTLGRKFLIINNSTGAVTVNSSGANLVQTVPANESYEFTCILLTGTSAASWDVAGATIPAANNTNSATYYPTFATTQGTQVSLGTNSNLTFNPLSGVLSLNGAPSNWNGSARALQVGDTSLYASGTTLHLTSNAYWDGTSQWIGETTASAAQYRQASGAHQWYGNTGVTAAAAFAPTLRMSLDTSGNLVATGNVTAYSDETVKINWRPLKDNFLIELSKVKYGVYDRTDIEATQVGVSAQSLRPVMPEAVNDIDGKLSVAYGNAAMTAVIELTKKVLELEARLAKFEV